MKNPLHLVKDGHPFPVRGLPLFRPAAAVRPGEHRALLEAAIARNADKACAIIEEHIGRTGRNILAVIREHP